MSVHHWRLAILSCVLVAASGTTVIGSETAIDEDTRTGFDFFENKIRPVLANRCFKCHAGEKREGDLRLDGRDFLIKGGQSGRAVIPGDANGSLLIRAIRRIDKDLQMPPKAKNRLTEIEIQDFVAWVKMGAPFPGNRNGGTTDPKGIDLDVARSFWSLQPIKKPPLPAVTTGDVSNPIDQFVRSELLSKGLKPSPRGEKRTLLRRVTYDLTGLPPTLAETDRFLSDDSPAAFAAVVERLLESPQYGVHWARHWLDVARYGDTRWVGAGEDRRWPFAFTYRDWVIKALNEDMPYDRFVTLQLAADQVADARPADQAALGFLTVGRWFTGKKPDVIDDQIDVVTRGLLGLTVQCARCHDHKYDPISAQDYYSLYGLFAAGRMPVDGTGMLPQLPAIAQRPVDETVEREIAALRSRADELLNSRLTELQTKFGKREMLLQYMPLAQSLLDKDDNAVREFAKSNELDPQLLLRWVRYLKSTSRNPHRVFAPWHALAAIPTADFAARAAAAIETVKTEKLNRYVVELLDPTPTSLQELSVRYIDLFLKYADVKETSEYDQEELQRVLTNGDSPVKMRTNELGPYLSDEQQTELFEVRRTVSARLAALPERGDLFLTYQHEAAPLLKEINDFLDERRAAISADLQSPTKIADYLLIAHEAETASERGVRTLAKSRQLSEQIVRRWIDYLAHPSRERDQVFAAWRVFAAANESEFTEQPAQLVKRARQAGDNKTAGNQLVAGLWNEPPKSLSDVANRYAELIAKCNRADSFDDADSEAIRQVSIAAGSPLRFAPRDVVDHFTRRDLDQLRGKERNLARLFLESPGVPPRAMILGESSHGYAQRVFVRGNPNIPGESSHGGFFSVLSSGKPQPFQAGRGRLELANKIVDPHNPLTARVIVNRVWQWHFGAGLVRSPSDFGVRGNTPTHPELLDWLARQFIADGWSLKKLHQRILLSQTWQQSSQDSPDLRAIDPENQLLWRMNRRRLGFEEMRDSLLAVSGRLDKSIGGPPADLAKNSVRRRTVFGSVDRIALPGFYRYFDFPGADAHVAMRQETIVAQQALYLMNNGFVLEQASHLSRRADSNAGSNSAARIVQLYRRILGRDPSGQERELSLAFIESQQLSETQAAEKTPTESPQKTEPGAIESTVQPSPWRYGWGVYDETKRRVTDFNSFTYAANNQLRGGPQEDDPLVGRASLHGRGGHAGINKNLAVIRRWIAPRGGKVSIAGIVNCQANSIQPSGDGVRARLVSSRHGQLGVWIAHGTEEPTDFPAVIVEAGDTIDFVVDARGRERMGGFTWAPILRMEGGVVVSNDQDGTKPMQVWDSAKDFKATTPAPVPFDVWARYAQVLLESNEFMFLD